MDERQREAAQERLALLEWVFAAYERRHEVVDLVWDSADREQAAVRLREFLDIEGGDPLVVLDMQIQLFTKDERDKLAAVVSELREVLGQA